MDEGEDGGVRADAEGQRQEDGEGESGGLSQLSQGEKHILHECGHGRSPRGNRVNMMR